MEKLDKEVLHWLKSVVGQLKSQGLSQEEALEIAKERAITIAFYAEVYKDNPNVKVVKVKPYYEVLKLLG
ncbi:hypothetical protein [Thermovibrio sp.]